MTGDKHILNYFRAEYLIKTINIVVFSLFIIISLLQKEAYCAPFNTPEAATNAYFGVCLKYLDKPTSSNLEKILDVDGVYFGRIFNKVKQAPDAYKKDEEIKAKEEEKKYFYALREEVDNRLFVFDSPTMRMAMGGGHQLFAIIHPGMKYKIVEIRDDQTLMGGNRKVAFVEVIYSDPAHSPGYQYGERGSVKKAVIKVVFDIYYLKNKKQAYIVNHYEPTKYKLELWGETPPPIKINNPIALKYIGTWEYDQDRQKHLIKISKDKEGRFKLEQGFQQEGNITWLNPDIKDIDGIYLNLSNGKMICEFISSNFYATHGMEYTYRIVLDIKSENKLIYSIYSSIRGETDKFEANKIND